MRTLFIDLLKGIGELNTVDIIPVLLELLPDDIPKDEVQIYDFDSDGKVVEIERDVSKLKASLMRRLRSRSAPRTRGKIDLSECIHLLVWNI